MKIPIDDFFIVVPREQVLKGLTTLPQAPIRIRSAACSLSESTHRNWTDEIDRGPENDKPKYVQWVVGCENVTTHVFSLSDECLSTRATVRPRIEIGHAATSHVARSTSRIKHSITDGREAEIKCAETPMLPKWN